MKTPSVPWYVAYESVRLYIGMLNEARMSVLLEGAQFEDLLILQTERATIFQDTIYRIGPVSPPINITELPPPYLSLQCTTEEEVKAANRQFQQQIINGDDIPLDALLGLGLSDPFNSQRI